MRFKEDSLQMAAARYLDTMGLLWCHVANERRSSIQAGARLKSKGVKSGVPDVLIFEPSSDYNGLAIELKIKPNKPSKNQKEWLERLSNSFWKTAVCYSIDEVIEEVKAYLRES